MAEITYICKRTVVSTKSVRLGECLPLSVLDRLMEPKHLRIVLYYQSDLARETGEWTRKLRESLSEMLTSFPKVTGRLQRDDEGRWMIKCNDAGVRVVEGRAQGNVRDWMQNVDREKELKLVHWEDMFHKPYYWSTFYVQLTEFEEGGLAIGLSCTHLLADPICATMFLKAWADTTLNQRTTCLPLFQPLPKRQAGHGNDPFHCNSLVNHYEAAITHSTPTVTSAKLTTVSFPFTESMISSCIAMARPPGDAPDGLSRPSPFEALAGLFWARISKVKGNEERLVSMSFGHDVRTLLGLEEGYFGNCMVYTKLHAGDNMEESGLHRATKVIGDAMAKMDKNEVMGLVDWLEIDDVDIQPKFLNISHLTCVNLEGIEPYTAIFENGCVPLHASYYIERPCEQGQILILPASSRDGPMSRVAMVTLPEDEMAKLCKDNLILSLLDGRSAREQEHISLEK